MKQLMPLLLALVLACTGCPAAAAYAETPGGAKESADSATPADGKEEGDAAASGKPTGPSQPSAGDKQAASEKPAASGKAAGDEAAPDAGGSAKDKPAESADKQGGSGDAKTDGKDPGTAAGSQEMQALGAERKAEEPAEEGEADVEAMGAPSLAGVYIVKSSLGTSIDIAGASMDAGANVQMYQDNNSPAQRFRFEEDGKGYYTVVNVNSGKALDVEAGVKASGQNVQQYTRNNTDAQKWKPVKTGDSAGSYYLVSKLSSSLCLDVSGASTASGANVQIYKKNGTAAQKFVLKKIEQTVKPGTYVVSSSLGSNLCLDILGASNKAGANADLYTKNDTMAQKFSVSYNANNGYYAIVNLGSGNSLDVSGASSSPGANVQQWSPNGSAAQKWSIEANGGGYRIRSGCSGLSLDVANGRAADYANVQVWSSNNTNAQKWTFSPTSLPAFKDGLYVMRSSIDTDFAAGIAMGSTGNSAKAQLGEYYGTLSQKFRIQGAGNGYVTITSLKSGKVLDVEGAGKANGTSVIQYASNGTDAQLWKPIPSNGGYRFQSKCNGLFLDVAGAAAREGTKIHVWSGNGTAAQRFVLTATDETTALGEGAFTIAPAANRSQAMNVSGGSDKDGAKVAAAAKQDSFAQKFKALAVSDGQYYLVNVGSSKYLDVDLSSRALQQWGRSTGTNQRWKIVATKEDESLFTIQSVATGTYLTYSNGALVLKAKDGSASQKFAFDKTTAFKVYLDAGHGQDSNGWGKGYDPGATGCGLIEARLTKELVEKVAAQCRKRGVEVYVNNYGGPYTQRHQEAVNMGCSTFVSIHFNAAGGSGVESYTHRYNKPAGSDVLQGILEPYLAAGTGLADRGKKSAEFAVVGGRLPSVLLEVGFIDNWNDMDRYLSRKDTVAAFLATGIQKASQNNACGWY